MARLSTDPRKCSQSDSGEVVDSAKADSYRFTPRPMIQKPARLWDRKPATPVEPRSKSHKIWKRFNTTAKAMHSTEPQAAIDVDMVDADQEVFFEEISLAKFCESLRGVKRQCVKAGIKSNEDGWEIAIVETKFDSEIFIGKRKLIVKEECGESYNTADEDIELDIDGDCETADSIEESIEEYEETPTKPVDNKRSISPLSESSDILSTPPKEMIDTALLAPVTAFAKGENITGFKIYEDEGNSPSALAEASDQETETVHPKVEVHIKSPPNVPPIFKRSFPDEDDDAELLFNFVSEAKAKRSTNGTSREKGASKKRVSANFSKSPRKGGRRGSKDLLSSIENVAEGEKAVPPDPEVSISSKPNEQDDKENQPKVNTTEEEPSTPSPRRRGRPKKVVPRVPDDLPLKRSDGTEFVFKQRTEAQQLALATKRNTKKNKGDSKLPNIVLKTINTMIFEETSSLSPESCGKTRKTVTWDEQNLVAFAEEQIIVEFDSPDELSPGRRSSRRLASLPAAPSTPLRSPVPRKMRKLGAKAASVNKDTLECIQVMTPPTVSAAAPSPVKAAKKVKPLRPINGTPIAKRKASTAGVRRVKIRGS
ncbi:hypothetical protein LOZ51_003053 [Ophidiomyces ophidiicola]|nr:hypothetical protein LOZ51_003053 [Ophidiomyces ophidiicola]